MKVYDQNSTPTTALESSRAQATLRSGRQEGDSRTAGSGGSGDRVELSGTINSLGRALSSYAADRAARVQSLAAQYQSGAYQPDSLAISRGMVSEALAGSSGTAH